MKSPVGPPPLPSPRAHSAFSDGLEAGFLDALVQIRAPWPPEWIPLPRVTACLGRAASLGLDEDLDRALGGESRVERVTAEDAPGNSRTIVEILPRTTPEEDTQEIGEKVPLAVLVVSLVCNTCCEVLIEAPHRFEKRALGLDPTGPAGRPACCEHLAERRAARTGSDPPARVSRHASAR